MDCGGGGGEQNDLGNDGGHRWQTTVGNNKGDDMGNDVGDGDYGGNNAGDNASKGDGGDTGGEREGGSWRWRQRKRRWKQRRQRQRRQLRWRRLHIAGVVSFLMGSYFCVVFFLWVGIGKVTPLISLLSRLRYVGVLLGGDGNWPQILWYVNTKNYLAKNYGNRSW